jgi:SH3-like domain-containing protein
MLKCLLLFLLFVLSTHDARAIIDEPESLPLPRFVSVKADELNVRTGPGTRYPVRWVYYKKMLPMEIVDEYEHWRKVRDVEGESGWVHKSLLSGRRTAIITTNIAVMRARPDKNATPLLRLSREVILSTLECAKDWCQLQHENTRGWVAKAELWGAYPEEIFR